MNDIEDTPKAIPNFRERWTNAAGMVVLAAISIAALLGDDSIYWTWKDWAIVVAAIIFPAWAIVAIIGAWRRWDEEEISAKTTKVVAWIIGLPIALALGYYALTSTSDWLKTIPSWAAVIIVLLFLILMKR